MQIDDYLALLKARRSKRLLKPDPVPDEYIQKILEAGRWAMSGANAQPWEFIVIKDKATRAKIVELFVNHMAEAEELEMHLNEEIRQPIIYTTKGPPGFTDAPVIMVVIGDSRTVQTSALQAYLFGGQDVLKMGLANCATLMHLAVAALGLGSQWCSISQPHEQAMRLLLGIPEYYRVRYFIPIGYPAYEPGPAPRRELSEITHYDRYDMSKYRSNIEVRDWIIALRKKMRARYPVVQGNKK